MGHSSTLRYASALAATLGLIGCAPEQSTETDVKLLQAEVQTLSARVEALESRTTDMRVDFDKQISGVRELGLENARNAESLTKTVNHNADAANKNAGLQKK